MTTRFWHGFADMHVIKDTEVVIASEQRLEADETSYEYANLLLLGLASLRAQQLETELRVLAVWALLATKLGLASETQPSPFTSLATCSVFRTCMPGRRTPAPKASASGAACRTRSATANHSTSAPGRKSNLAG